MMMRASDLPTNTLYQLASQAWRSGSLYLAIETYRQVVRLIDPADMLALSQVLWELGAACLDFDQPKPAISVLKNARGAAHVAQLPLREAECLTALGQAYRQTQRPRIALTCFQQAHPLLANLEVDAALGRLWNQQGLTHGHLKAYSSAREDYTQALSIARTVRDQQLEIEALRNMGKLSAGDLDEFDQGIEYLERALTILRAQEDPYTRKNATTLVQILAELSSIKMQRKETIADVFSLLVEAESMVRLSFDQALAARISYLMDAASLMHLKQTQQTIHPATKKTLDDDLAFWED